MKRIWKEIWLAALMGLVLPGIILSAAAALIRERQPLPREPAVTASVAVPVPEQEIPVLDTSGRVIQMPLSDYLTGVLLAELPSDFAPEAKMAQAVVARTYTLRAWEQRTKHEAAAVCMDSTCCQAYRSPEAHLELGGDPAAIDSARSAVAATAGQVLTYGDSLIEATYFSCSGGSTEDAVAVWGTDVPYLQATPSPGEEDATHYTDTVTFSPAEFSAALGLELAGQPESWFGDVTYTEGSGVAQMDIGGTVFTGTDLRKALGLRSTAFTVTVSDTGITVTTRGFGHRVGMSQYGANAMAKSGSSYAEILAHYYQGTALEQRSD